jgi:hypothetical protein
MSEIRFNRRQFFKIGASLTAGFVTALVLDGCSPSNTPFPTSFLPNKTEPANRVVISPTPPSTTVPSPIDAPKINQPSPDVWDLNQKDKTRETILKYVGYYKEISGNGMFNPEIIFATPANRTAAMAGFNNTVYISDFALRDINLLSHLFEEFFHIDVTKKVKIPPDFFRLLNISFPQYSDELPWGLLQDHEDNYTIDMMGFNFEVRKNPPDYNAYPINIGIGNFTEESAANVTPLIVADKKPIRKPNINTNFTNGAHFVQYLLKNGFLTETDLFTHHEVSSQILFGSVINQDKLAPNWQTDYLGIVLFNNIVKKMCNNSKPMNDNDFADQIFAFRNAYKLVKIEEEKMKKARGYKY